MADFGRKSRFLAIFGVGVRPKSDFFPGKSMTAIELGVVFGRIGAIYDAQLPINWVLCTDFDKNSIFETQPF